MEFGIHNETGRKTFFWYRVYCASLAVLYLLVLFGGLFLLAVPIDTTEYKREEILLISIAYIVVGAIFFVVFAVALFLPPKPYNWIVGIVMLAIGMMSCCLWPAVVPLLIFWIKPETQAYFGRKNTS